MKSTYSPLTSVSKFKQEISNSIPLQILIEEIYHNKLDLVAVCYQVDKSSNSALDPQIFKAVISKYCPGFTEYDLKGLIAVAPKNDKGQILYRDLSFALDVF